MFCIVEGFGVAGWHLISLKRLFTKITLANYTLANREKGNPEDMEVLLENVYMNTFSAIAMSALLSDQELKQQSAAGAKYKHNWILMSTLKYSVENKNILQLE